MLCQERAKQWAEPKRKHRSSLRNTDVSISSGKVGEFVHASEFLALQQGNPWTNIIHIPTHNIYRKIFSAMRGPKGDQWTIKIPLKWWLTESLAPQCKVSAIKSMYHFFFLSFPPPTTLIALPWRFWNKISQVHIQLHNTGEGKTLPI